MNIPAAAIPPALRELVRSLPAQPFSKLIDKDGDFALGPIPKGFPVNLAANYQPLADINSVSEALSHKVHFTELLGAFVLNWPSLDLNADDTRMLAWAAKLRGPLLKLLKCPDFVVNRGHYFGTSEFDDTSGLSRDEKAFGPETPLSDDDKRALIEFIKTF